jgi:hypothetical protein
MNRSEFWREISWRVGDIHANRIDWLVRAYCKLFRLDYWRLSERVPR